MPLMTNSPDINSPFGLITIEEVSDNVPQNVLFTIQLEHSQWRKINNSHDLKEFISKTKISMTLMAKGEEIDVLLENESELLVLNYLGKRIEFYIDPVLNLNSKQHYNSVGQFWIEIFIILTSIFQLVTVTMMYKLIKELKKIKKENSLELDKRMNVFLRMILFVENKFLISGFEKLNKIEDSKFNIPLISSQGLKYEYTGEKYLKKYFKNKFIILSLKSTKELDELFIEQNVFLI